MNEHPPLAARRVAPVWRELARDQSATTPGALSRIASLPAPARRWLTRAITGHSSTMSSTLLTMHGRIRIGQWRRFTARQVIAPGRGYIWAATARFGPLPVLGYDRYSEGSGEMRWRLAGIVPVMSASGSDVTRSAAGRLAGELVLTPRAALSPDIRWETLDDDRAIAHLAVGGVEHAVTVEVDRDGVLRSVQLPRWGDPLGNGYGTHLFRVQCTGDREHGDVRLPERLLASWQTETTEVPFFDATID